MAKIDILDDGAYLISNLSITEITRQFVKISPKEIPHQFIDEVPPVEFKIKSNAKVIGKIVWGTQNRLYIKQKILKFSEDISFKLHFLDKSSLEIINT